VKYIVFSKDIGDGIRKEYPVIIPNDLTHADVANGMMEYCPELKGATVVGAGELSCMDIQPECHGSSPTLGVPSRGTSDDRAFIMRDYHHGVIDA
jgi:hypothetical protein